MPNIRYFSILKFATQKNSSEDTEYLSQIKILFHYFLIHTSAVSVNQPVLKQAVQKMKVVFSPLYI